MSNPHVKLSQVLAELKADYLKSLPAKIAHLQELTQQHDWHNLSEEYHKLKGTGKTYGFPEVSILCEKLEHLALQKETQIPGIFLQAVGVLERMLKAYSYGQDYDLQSDPLAKTILEMRYA